MTIKQMLTKKVTMGSKTVIITRRAKLEYSLGSILVRDADETKSVLIDDISILIIENQGIAITGVLLSELVKQKVKVIFCDEKHNPLFECMPYYGAGNTSLRVRSQVKWSDEDKNAVWDRIIALKISHQAKVLEAFDKENANKLLLSYIDEIKNGDETNREGHAAKVYFNSLFGAGFSRRDDTPLNAKLNYGYSLLLSMCAREITALGFITQLGIHHDNSENSFNFACDMMEPFRPIVDSIVNRKFLEGEFTTEVKRLMISAIVEAKVVIKDKVYKLPYAIGKFVQNAVSAIENKTFIEDFDYGY